MTKYSLLICLLFFMLLPRCTPTKPSKNLAIEQINWASETPETVMDRIGSANNDIQILTAFFALNMNPPPAKMMSSMSGVFTLDQRETTPKVRIRAFHLFGSTLFDMVNSDTTKIYVPRKKTLYIGKNSKTEQEGNGPQTIFANMMLSPDSLILKDDSTLKIQDKTVRINLTDGYLLLDKSTGFITTRHKEKLHISYSKYQTIKDGISMPTAITIQANDKTFTATCTLSELTILETLPDHYFELLEYKPESVLDLQELQQ